MSSDESPGPPPLDGPPLYGMPAAPVVRPPQQPLLPARARGALLIVAGVVGMTSAVLPWERYGLLSLSMARSGLQVADGKLTFGLALTMLAVGVGVLALRRSPNWLAPTLVVVGTLQTIIGFADVRIIRTNNRTIGDATGSGFVHPGAGVWLAGIAGLLIAACGLGALRLRVVPQFPTIGAETSE